MEGSATQLSDPPSLAMNPKIKTYVPCERSGCTHLSEIELEQERLCRPHFIAKCYAKLDEIAERIKNKMVTGPAPAADRNFLAECTGQVTSEALRAFQVDNKDRAQLLHILVFANELICQLRRSERIPKLVPVRLIRDTPSDTWVEETVTQDLSKHGAMLRCTHPHARGETLELVRLDTGHRAIARVVWREYDKFSQYKVALEILNSPNFWNLRAETGSPL
jgi:hypothetical protein